MWVECSLHQALFHLPLRALSLFLEKAKTTLSKCKKKLKQMAKLNMFSLKFCSFYRFLMLSFKMCIKYETKLIMLHTVCQMNSFTNVHKCKTKKQLPFVWTTLKHYSQFSEAVLTVGTFDKEMRLLPISGSQSLN